MSIQTRSIKLLAGLVSALALGGCAPEEGAPVAEGAQAIEGAALVATPASFDFGRVPINSTAQTTFRITNRSAYMVDVTDIFPPGPCRPNLIIPCVRPGETTSLNLACTPATLGSFGGTMVLDYQVNGAPGSLRIPVAGTAYSGR